LQRLLLIDFTNASARYKKHSYCLLIHKATYERPKSHETEAGMDKAEIVCPECGHSDKIRKVSAIVAEEIHSVSGTQFMDSTFVDKEGGIHYHSHPAPYSGIQTSGRAEQFLPPPEPTPKRFSALLTAFGVLLLFVGGIMLAGFLVIIGGKVLLSLGDVSNSGLETLVGPVFIFGCISINIVFWMIIGLLILRAKPKHETKEKERVAREKPLWRDAMKKWERLYYCERDDVVFDPETHKSCQRQAIREFIYQSD
jgi:hypothetical protein